jgi:1,2-diacylglycerol-3-alpha-glucose alpha-1,2-glucosyltransferase
MKVLLYFQNENAIKTSGIGRALRHQMRALTLANVPFTTNPKDSFDIAHINTVWHKSRRLLKKCQRHGIPVIVHGHSTYEDFRNSFALWRWVEPYFDAQLRYMYSHADLIITPTPYAKGLIDGYGFKTKTIAISNGIDVTEYAPSREAQKAFRERFAIKEGEPFVMGVGFPFERKGLHDFFEVARSFPTIKFIWFGHLAAPLMNAKVKKWIRQRPANAIMAGYCKGDLIHGAYQTATCLFFPSYEETEGIVVLEALASRCPLIVRDIGVYKPWLSDGVNAHLCRDDASFARAIASLLESGEKKEILDAGFAVAEERSLDKIGAELKAAYESLMAEKRSLQK